MGITTVSRKGQITLPKDARERLGIKAGEKVEVKIEDGRIVLEPLRRPSESMKGIAQRAMEILKANAVDLINEMRRGDAEEL
jgi:AbrB family looped-hinge helix DNA binding protein